MFQVSMPGILRFSAFFANSAPNLSYRFFCRVRLLFFKLFWFSRYRKLWHEDPPIQIHPTLQCTHCVVKQPLPLRQNSFFLLAFFKTPCKSCLDQCIACFLHLKDNSHWRQGGHQMKILCPWSLLKIANLHLTE